jgi:hypothetical protein
VTGLWELTGTGNTGRNIQLINGTSLDFETSASYTVTVTVTDGLHSVDHAVAVSVIDVDDTPVLTVTPSSPRVQDYAVADTSVTGLSLLATDQDMSGVFRDMEWEVREGGSVSSRFYIRESGNKTAALSPPLLVRPGAGLDYESNASHTLTIRVRSSSGGAWSVARSVTIRVLPALEIRTTTHPHHAYVRLVSHGDILLVDGLIIIAVDPARHASTLEWSPWGSGFTVLNRFTDDDARNVLGVSRHTVADAVNGTRLPVTVSVAATDGRQASVNITVTVLRPPETPICTAPQYTIRDPLNVFLYGSVVMHSDLATSWVHDFPNITLRTIASVANTLPPWGSHAARDS